MWGPVLAPLIGGIFSVIDKAVGDKDEALRIKARLHELAINGELAILEAAGRAVIAEAQGESWLQRNWRPLLMLLFGAIIANNHLFQPLLGTPPTPLPEPMWELLKIGVGGYVVGRSVEKGIRLWKE